MSVDTSLLPHVLAYSRSLQNASDEIEAAYRPVNSAQRVALRKWRGTYSNRMVDIRQPEEMADTEIAVAAMRSEAELWAETWAALVDRHNWEQYDETVREAEEFAREHEGTSMHVAPYSTVPLPDRALVPNAPGFLGGESFVSYARRGDGTYRALYSSHPGGGHPTAVW